MRIGRRGPRLFVSPPLLRTSSRHAVFIDGVRGDSVSMLTHLTIYNGRQRSETCYRKTLRAPRSHATMFRAFKLPIVIQTLLPEHLAEIRAKMADWPRACPGFFFKLFFRNQPTGKPNGGVLLCCFCSAECRMFIREPEQGAAATAVAIIDEGLRNPEMRCRCRLG